MKDEQKRPGPNRRGKRDEWHEFLKSEECKKLAPRAPVPRSAEDILKPAKKQ